MIRNSSHSDIEKLGDAARGCFAALGHVVMPFLFVRLWTFVLGSVGTLILARVLQISNPWRQTSINKSSVLLFRAVEMTCPFDPTSDSPPPNTMTCDE